MSNALELQTNTHEQDIFLKQWTSQADLIEAIALHIKDQQKRGNPMPYDVQNALIRNQNRLEAYEQDRTTAYYFDWSVKLSTIYPEEQVEGVLANLRKKRDFLNKRNLKPDRSDDQNVQHCHWY